MKIVINTCFGGFSLSPLALEAYAKRKGKKLYWYIYDCMRQQYSPVTRSEAMKSTKTLLAYDKPFMDEKEMGDHLLCSGDIPRDDKDLVAVVEELGKRANGFFANLKVVKIPDGIEWVIDEYDGVETIEEAHRSWA
jgi:hypothetical protein